MKVADALGHHLPFIDAPHNVANPFPRRNITTCISRH
jgi:hypothetical protein